MSNTETLTADDARAFFDAAIAEESNPDTVAKLELAREYFTTPGFAERLADFCWEAR